MRAGPLSDKEVVDVLNTYFVPVYLTIDAYEPDGSASDAEKAEFQRICDDISEAKKGIAFIVHPDGGIIETLISSPATTVERVAEVLKRAHHSIRTTGGTPLGNPIPQAPPPAVEVGGLVLHLAARYLPNNGKGWARMPAEDWIVLDPEECAKFMGDAKGVKDETWTIDSNIADKILKHFYPPCLNFYVEKGRLDKKELSAEVVSVNDGVALIRIDGSMKMKRDFTFAKEDNPPNFVEADIIGYAEYDIAAKRLRSIELITDKGTYAGAGIGIAVTSKAAKRSDS